MPKQDRCAALKKETASERRRIAAAKIVAEKETRAAEKERLAAEKEQPPPAEQADERAAAAGAAGAAGAGGLRPRGRAEVKAPSSFARAAQTMSVEDSLEASDGEGGEAAAPAAGPSQERARSGREPMSNSCRKKQQAERHRDELHLLAKEQWLARKGRITQRLLHLVLIGFLLDSWRGARETKVAKPREEKAKRKGGKTNGEDRQWSLRGLKDMMEFCGGPLLLVFFTLALFAARLAAEDFSPHDAALDQDVNLYEVLGIDTDADVPTLRKAYKALALSWHPDKNPDCDACASRFARISQAYETLSNPEQRKAYDHRKAPEGSLESVASVDLTAEDFETRVLRSNDVWYVQVYEPTDGLCKQFHPLWEDVAHTFQHVARFGRIDASKHRRALGLLPQRVVMTPLVFRFARGHTHEIYQWVWSYEERGSAEFERFIHNTYPAAQRMASPGELRAWWEVAEGRPRFLLTGPVSAPLNAQRTLEFMQVRRLATMWSEFFDIATADSKMVEPYSPLERQISGSGKAHGAVWWVSMRVGVQLETKAVTELRDVSKVFQELIARVITLQAPAITLRNHQQLCGAHGVRTFCLLLVDAENGPRIDGALSELNASRASYASEVVELRAAGEEEVEELFQIQPLRVLTSSSRLPWHPVAAGVSFKSIWAHAEWAPAFLLEFETRRIAAVKTASFQDLFQRIAYDELTFHDLPESVPLARSLPDPEIPLRREVVVALSTVTGAVAAYLLACVAIAVLPELGIVTVGSLLASAFGFLLACWPSLCRRCIAVVWCATGNSRSECLAVV